MIGLSSLPLVTDCCEDLELDAILRPTRRLLHSNQILEIAHLHDDPVAKVARRGIALEILEPTDAGRHAEDVERSEGGDEREVHPLVDRLGVEQERNVLVDAPQPRLELNQDIGKAP